MRPCWKPDSSPLRSDQGESRTPMPLQARRSERRVSACSTTWPIAIARMGIEPTASLGLSKGGLPIAYRAEVPGAGVEPTLAGSEPDVLPVRRPRSRCFLDSTPLHKVRGEGVEPSRAASKTAGLPLADPRE